MRKDASKNQMRVVKVEKLVMNARVGESGDRSVHTKKIEKIVEVHNCKVGNPSHRHGQVEVHPWISAVFIKSADKLAKEMTHDLEVNFNKIKPFGKEDTAKELQNHAAKTQDT